MINRPPLTNISPDHLAAAGLSSDIAGKVFQVLNRAHMQATPDEQQLLDTALTQIRSQPVTNQLPTGYQPVTNGVTK